MITQQQLPDLIDAASDEVGDMDTRGQSPLAASGRISRLASAGKAIGSSLLGVGFLAVIILATISGGLE